MTEKQKEIKKHREVGKLKAGQIVSIQGRQARLIYKIDEDIQAKMDTWSVRFMDDGTTVRKELPH